MDQNQKPWQQGIDRFPTYNANVKRDISLAQALDVLQVGKSGYP